MPILLMDCRNQTKHFNQSVNVLKVTSHIVISSAFSIPMMGLAPEGAFLFFLTSVLIDVDHLFFYCFHEKTISIPILKSSSIYKVWQYFGPRVQLFHNYETLIFTGMASWYNKGLFLPVFLGALFHLFCDQTASIHSARYLRIKTLTGDIIRYYKYLKTKNRGNEMTYMTQRRNTWWNHLRSHLPNLCFETAKLRYGILNLYPDIPIKSSEDTGNWNMPF